MPNIRFIEKSHQYFVDGIEFISATTLVDRYRTEFDSDFWSRYKAIERVFKERYGDSKGTEYFQELKSQRSFKAPGFEAWICDIERIDRSELDALQVTILEEWRIENEESKIKGTAHHLEKEEEAYTKGYSLNPFTGKTVKTIPAKEESISELKRLAPGYYPELKIWNLDYGVIGTADRVFIGTGTRKDPRPTVWIDDYKTNKEIKKTNLYERMLYPLIKLQDCNYNHYRLQIGLYAWMLEQQGYNVKGISINHMGELHKMRYSSIKPFVEIMLDHYAGKGIMEMKGVARYGFSPLHLLK